ncbi:MAG: UDP-N-acetylmuramoyl-tripeptide--D-alanyl-D-alanine ligase [Pseudomonadota bacterium]
MLDLSLRECADVLNAELIGGDVEFSSVSTDTRTLKTGQLMVALVGEKFDAHEKIDAEVASKAAGFVVQRQLPFSQPQLVVQDTLRALGDIARVWRNRISAPVVAITGSNGKTTVKEMTAAILRECGKVFYTQGNLNNEIGLPLSVLSIDKRHEFVVLELGANHAGEIDYLTHIAKPLVALVNNAGPSHLEGFGSLDGVAHAKAEIYNGLSDNGVAIINADDHYAPLWRECIGEHRMLSFGVEERADVTGRKMSGDVVQIVFEGQSVEFFLPLPGQHNLMNALAAASAGLAVGASLEQIAQGLSKIQATRGRLEFKAGRHGIQLLDDSYNANPASLQAGLDVLCDAADGRRICVLGEMRELGDRAAQMHRSMGAAAREQGVDLLFSLGTFATELAEGFGVGARAFDDIDELIEALDDTLTDGDWVLVKGSRGARMERVVQALIVDQQEGNR